MNLEKIPFCEVTDLSPGFVPTFCYLEGLIKLLSACGHIISSEKNNVLCVYTIDKFDIDEGHLITKALPFVHYRHVKRSVLAVPGSRRNEDTYVYLPQVSDIFCDIMNCMICRNTERMYKI